MPDFLQQLRPPIVLLGMLAVAGMTLLGAYLYLFKGDVSEFSRLRQVRTQSALDVAAQEIDGAVLSRMEQHVEKLEAALYGNGSRLSPNQMVPHIIGQLDRLSGRHGVQLLSVKPGDAAKVLMFEEVPFDVAVNGEYFNLFAWLKDAETELRPMVFKQFQILPAGREGQLTMSLRVVSYRPSDREN